MSNSSKEFRKQNKCDISKSENSVKKIGKNLFLVGNHVYYWENLTQEQKELYNNNSENGNEINQEYTQYNKPKAPTPKELEDFWYNR